MEKPLHVRVAEALGWAYPTTRHFSEADPQVWCAVPTAEWANSAYAKAQEPAYHGPGGERVVPRYDSAWAATGPLIEQFGICLERIFNDRRYAAFTMADRQGGFISDGDTPLLAICNLILALSQSDRLRPESWSH